MAVLRDGSGSEADPDGGGDRLDRRSFVVVGALVLALLGAGFVGVEIGRRHAPTRALPAEAAALPSASSPARSPVDRAQGVPTATPAGIRWRLYAGLVMLPYSSTAGPARVSGAVASGFAHTPLGALLAVEQTSPRYASAPTPDWRAETLAQVLPGPGRDRFIAWRVLTPDAAPAGGYAQIAGFRFVTYSPAAAVIQTVYRQPDQGLHAGTETVRWVGGDWRLELQPDGESTPTVQPVQDLAGFVPFSGGP